MILPDTYMGYVEIFHGIAGAAPLERSQGGAAIYRISANGTLYTSSDDDPAQQNWYRRRYFYQKTDGSLETIMARWPIRIRETDPDFLAPTIGVYQETGYKNVMLEDGMCRFGHQSFFVGTKKYIRSIEGRPRHDADLYCDAAREVRRTEGGS